MKANSPMLKLVMLEKNGKILFLQHNTNTNPINMHTCLEYGIENKLDFILFQESWIYKDNITIILHAVFYYIVSDI